MMLNALKTTSFKSICFSVTSSFMWKDETHGTNTDLAYKWDPRNFQFFLAMCCARRYHFGPIWFNSLIARGIFSYYGQLVQLTIVVSKRTLLKQDLKCKNDITASFCVHISTKKKDNVRKDASPNERYLCQSWQLHASKLQAWYWVNGSCERCMIMLRVRVSYLIDELSSV